MEEKVQAILQKEGFVDKLLACQEPEEVQKLFAAEGLELSLDEVKAVGKGLDAAFNDGEELDEDSLDSVAGGSAALAMAIVSGVVTVVKLVKDNWRSIKNWFRRW